MIRQVTRSWWPLLAVAVLLAAVGAAATVASPQLTRLPVPAATGEPRGVVTEDAPTPVPREAEQPQDGDRPRPAVPGWVLVVILVILLGVVVGGLGILLWIMARGRLRSRPGRLDEDIPVPAVAAADAQEVVAAVDAGLSDLSDTDLDPRRAVIACWVRLEQVAAAAGVPREVSDTSTDLVTRLLTGQVGGGPADPASPGGGFAVDPAVLAAFADIYRLARYTSHPVDEQMRGQARAALARVRAELTAEVPA